MSKKGQDFSLGAGETINLTFEVEDIDSLDNIDVWWVFAESERARNDSIVKKTVDNGIEKEDNTFTVTLESEDTIDLVPGDKEIFSKKYYHEAWLEDGTGEIQKVAEGEMVVYSTVQPTKD